jgi:hypothetical protein
MAGKFFTNWTNLPILCWAYDTPEAWQDIIGKDLYKEKLEQYTKRYNDKIAPILFEMGMKFNLGGEQEKSRLETTSRPIGVFDFSLASKGLYKVQEYYSQELALEHPKIFEAFGLPSGVVPPNLVDNIVIGSIKNFVYTHNGKTYVLEKRQKGTTAIEDGVKDAKLKFATTTKDVYLKFKRSGGKVRYAEIYSVFYFSELMGDDEYAIRHLPALMTAQYFESIGIKTRIYMTRFVNIDSKGTLRKNDLLTNAILPMYTQYYDENNSAVFRDEVIFAPIIVKDFGQDLDWKSCLAVSQQSDHDLYFRVINSMLQKEISSTLFSPYGNPVTTQQGYLIAFQRYKQKYQTYVKAGIWKSKEIQEDSQLFFHSQSIRMFLSKVRNDLRGVFFSRNISKRDNWKDFLEVSIVARAFFEWWMKIAAGRCRDTLMIMNAKEPRKEVQKTIDELKTRIDDITSFLNITVPRMYATNNANNDLEREIASVLIQGNYIEQILREEGLPLDFNDRYNYDAYLSSITEQATTYAAEPLFPTDKETVERLNQKAEVIETEVKLRS